MSNYNFSYFDNNNDEMEELDKMARELNDKKKKFNLIKEVHQDFYDETQKNKKMLEAALEEDKFRCFSANGTSGTNINNLKEEEISETKSSENKTINTHDSFIKDLTKYKKKEKKKNNINESQDENLSLLIDHLKKEHNSHIFSESESIISNSQESIIKHLKKCSKCKSKIQLVFNDNHKKKDTDDSFNSKSLTIRFSDLKEYMTIILLGILILLIIYIFFKFK